MILTADPMADIATETAKVVRFYYDHEDDIREICEPHWAITLNQSQAEVDAARAIAVFFPVDALTALLLAGMWFENNSK